MSLANHVRYLELRLAGFVPASIHERQIAAYSSVLEHARKAANAAAYLDATNDLLELTRAEWTDRYHGAARLYDSIGDPVRAEIARRNADAAADASDHDELLSAIVTAKIASTRRREGVEAVAAQIPILVFSVATYRLTPESARGELRVELDKLWGDMVASDPDLTPSRLCSSPYRARLPFGDRGLKVVIEWLDELEWTASPPPAAEVEPTPAFQTPRSRDLPSVNEVAAAYRAAAAVIDESDPRLEPLRRAYQRVDELASEAQDGQELLAAIAGEGLPLAIARAPLLAAAEQAMGELDSSQHAATCHYRRLVGALSAARSVAELELVQLAADEHLATETSWAQLLLSFALRSIAPALSFENQPSPAARAFLRSSEEMVVALFGAGTAALLAAPTVWRTFEREVFENGQTVSFEADDSTVRFGEPALDVAAHVRAAHIAWGFAELERLGGGDAEKLFANKRFPSAEAMRDHVVSIITDVAPAPGDSLWPLEMWGEAVSFTELGEALESPPRPLFRL